MFCSSTMLGVVSTRGGKWCVHLDCRSPTPGPPFYRCHDGLEHRKTTCVVSELCLSLSHTHTQINRFLMSAELRNQVRTTSIGKRNFLWYGWHVVDMYVTYCLTASSGMWKLTGHVFVSTAPPHLHPHYPPPHLAPTVTSRLYYPQHPSVLTMELDIHMYGSLASLLFLETRKPVAICSYRCWSHLVWHNTKYLWMYIVIQYAAYGPSMATVWQQ